MKLETYLQLRHQVAEMGYGAEIDWTLTVGPPESAEDFAAEVIFVIANSGMKATIARGIYERVMLALRNGESARRPFGHAGKAAAMDAIWRERDKMFAEYLTSVDKIAWLVELPWIGDITKYHVARNFGLDFVKPDRHLQRIAEAEDKTPAELCGLLAAASGDRIGTVDYVLWRAAERGLIKTRELAQGALL